MSRLIVNSLKAAGAAIALALVILILLCAALGKPQDASGLLAPASYATLAVISFLCGFISVKLNGEKGLLSGACSGAVFAFILFVASLFTGGEGGVGFWLKLLIYGIVIAVSAAGGFIGIPRKSAAKIRKSIVSKYS